MRLVDHQLALALHEVSLVDAEVIERQHTLTRAIVVCGDLAGFEDKQAADAAGLDAATWSRFKSGQTNFPHSRFTHYQQVCQNWLPLQWLARDAGFRLERLETVLERQLREERDRRIKAEDENKLLRDLVQGRAK